MKVEKLIDKLLAKPTPAEMDFNDVDKILKHEGWRCIGRKKHFLYEKEGEPLIAIPCHSRKEKVEQYVLKEIIERLKLEEKYGKE